MPINAIPTIQNHRSSIVYNTGEQITTPMWYDNSYVCGNMVYITGFIVNTKAESYFHK